MQRRGVAPVVWAAIGVIIALAIVLSFVWYTPVQHPSTAIPNVPSVLSGPCTTASCLIDAAKICRPTMYTWNQTFVASQGKVIIAKTIEIKGPTSTGCSIDVRMGQAFYSSAVPESTVNAFLSTQGTCSLSTARLDANLGAALAAGRFPASSYSECKGFAGTFA